MKYKHTQVGYLIIYTLVGMVLLFGFILTQSGFNLLISSVMFFVLFILASFSSLTVMVNEQHLRIKFGYGIYSKIFLLNDIISAETVRNKWYYGWGIRMWFWPKMVIFNVSGFDAVEIKLKNNKVYRIGTDEPRELEGVILRSIK
tara:strand:- start:1207 stop:1641 length:435 start_codon:yes stop_codon:yes gene_type:complete